MRSWTIVRVLLVGAVLASCATTDQVHEKIEETRTGPKHPPVRNITNFSSALQCMDQMMIDYGAPDVVVLMEDLTDTTGKVKAGTRDMLIAALLDMTKRSRAIRINAYGADSGNLISFYEAAGRQSIYHSVPPYDIRGSISQMDTDVVQRQADAGVAMEQFGIGVAQSAGGSVLGLDLSMISTGDLSVIPGVSSRNSIVVMSSGKALESDATIAKAGINFGISITEKDGTGQALRNLIELASIELFGRLFKLPYWECLGIPEDNPEIQRELSDWYFSMQVHGELVGYLQRRLRRHGYYHGRIDGVDSPELREAIGSYRASAGLSSEDAVDLELFRALVTRSTDLQISVEPEAARPLVEILSSADSYERGERLELDIRAGQNGYLTCFYTDQDGQLLRFFPNRFQDDGYVTVDTVVEIPGSMPFELTASEQGTSERVNCFLTSQDVLRELPEPVRSADFENLGSASIVDLRQEIHNTVGGDVDEAELEIRVQN